MKLTRDAFCDLRNEAQRALRRSKELAANRHRKSILCHFRSIDF